MYGDMCAPVVRSCEVQLGLPGVLFAPVGSQGPLLWMGSWLGSPLVPWGLDGRKGDVEGVWLEGGLTVVNKCDK